MANEGKRWEKNFKDSMGDTCIRLYDTTNGYAGVNNPCDFIYYSYPFMFMFELKSVASKRLPFSNITDKQFESLIKFNKEIGIKAGICVEFREVKECYYIPINTIEKYKLLHYKSITNDMCKEDRSIILIPTVYKQVNCKIIKSKFDDELHEVRI